MFLGTNSQKHQEKPIIVCHDHLQTPTILSFGKPKPAAGLDIRLGVIVRYDEKAKEVVGLTIVGVGHRLEEYMKKGS